MPVTGRDCLNTTAELLIRYISGAIVTADDGYKWSQQEYLSYEDRLKSDGTVKKWKKLCLFG